MLLVLSALGAVPTPLWPECGTPDRPDLCPSDLGEEWTLLSYVPAAWTANVRDEEEALGTGLRVDRAWRTSTGRTDVVIAVLDSGIEWDNASLLRKHVLNGGELPGALDLDGDGALDVDDFAGLVDPAAGVDAADAVLDPSDVIATYSDGVDDDGNGFVDDVAGWDFADDDNDPYDDLRYGHGTGMAEHAAAEADDATGDIGACPNCMVLNLRVGPGFVVDGSPWASALLYATDMGAAVVLDAIGALGHSSHARVAIDRAWDAGVVVIGSAGDETAWHANPPGAERHTVYVHAIRHDGGDADESTSFLAYSNCSNRGPRLDLSASSPDCSSEATGNTAGVAGLVVSAARDAGLDPSAAELWQVLVGTADDIWLDRDDVYPSHEGWDAWFGYGRIDAAAAVEMVAAGVVPPVADLIDPDWMDQVTPGATVTVSGVVTAPRSEVASWVLEAAEGLEPTAWTEVARGDGPVDGVLAEWTVPDPGATFGDYAAGTDQVGRERLVHAATVQLRLVVTDVEGRVGVARRAVNAHRDPDLLAAFPLRLGASLEASPKLVDLDGDGAREIIVADADGRVHALRGDGTSLPGWPARVGPVTEVDPENPANHLGAPAYQEVDPDVGQPIIATPAVADLDGDGTIEVVVATIRGEVWVFGADGAVRDGFPVRQAPVDGVTEDNTVGVGFLSSPALGDLDGDGAFEIVIGGWDQQVYAWTADGDGMPGWPVRTAYPGYEDAGAKIVSSPAVGDLDGDGREEVIIGTNERLDGEHAALYALTGDGSDLPGWPVWLYSLSTEILPLVGEGFPGSAALVDLDGDGTREVVAHGMGGDLTVFDASGEELATWPDAKSAYGEGSNASDNSFLPLMNAPSAGDLDGDGLPDVVSGAAGIDYMRGMESSGQYIAFDHVLAGWSGADGALLPGWPRLMEDLQFFQNPAVADLDGDGKMEAITTSGGGMVHAWDVDGAQPAGWPKLAGQWVIATPSVGDIDGDGLLDVVVGTRQGLLLAWTTASPADAPVAWAGFGHDARNTHDHEAPLPGYNGRAAAAPMPAEGCGCATGGERGWIGLVVGLAALGARRRR